LELAVADVVGEDFLFFALDVHRLPKSPGKDLVVDPESFLDALEKARGIQVQLFFFEDSWRLSLAGDGTWLVR